MKENKTLTHWKKLQNPNYLGSYAFQPEEDKIATIDFVGPEMVQNPDGKKEECSVVHFKEKNIKPLILNVTNSKTIAMILGTPYIEEWVNNKITLYVAQIKAFGEDMEAVRVRPKKPIVKKQALPVDSPRFNDALTSLRNKEITLAVIESRFDLTTEAKEIMRGVIDA